MIESLAQSLLGFTTRVSGWMSTLIVELRMHETLEGANLVRNNS